MNDVRGKGDWPRSVCNWEVPHPEVAIDIVDVN